METKIAAQKGKLGAGDADEILYMEEDDEVNNKDFLKEGRDLSGITSVRRPPAPVIDPKKDDFIFMQIDTDYYTAIPPAYVKNFNPSQETPIIRMFGVTERSNSVSLHVHNFTPYFYVKINTQQAPALDTNDLMAIKDLLNKMVAGSTNGGDQSYSIPVKAVELVKDKASVMHYQSDKGTFLKIYTGLPKYVN